MNIKLGISYDSSDGWWKSPECDEISAELSQAESKASVGVCHSVCVII